MSANRLWMRIALLSVLAGAVLIGIGIGVGGTYHDGYGIHLGMDNENDFYKIDLEEFHELDVDLEYGDFTIQLGEDWKIEIENLPEDQFNADLNDGKLTIKTDYDSEFALFHWEIMSSSPTITLTVPQSHDLKKVTIQSAMGDVKLEDIKADQVEVEQAMGDIQLSDVWAESITLDQSMGDVVYDGKHPGNMKINNSMGAIEVSIEDDEDQYRYECTTAMGSIKASGHKENGASVQVKSGSASAPFHLDLENDMGDIELEFEDDWD